MNQYSKFLKSSFLLWLPPIAWHIAFGRLLPKGYAGMWIDTEAPLYLLVPENILLIVLMALSLFMPLFIFTRLQRTGLILYIVGLFMYFLSWRPLILYPTGAWSTSIYGHLAPAIVQLIWMAGVAMMGYSWSFNYRFSRWVYFLLALLYVLLDATHIYLSY